MTLDRPLRVAMFTDCYTPIINGVVSSILALKTALERAGQTVDIYCPHAPGELPGPEPGVYRFASSRFVFQPEQRFTWPWPRRPLREFASRHYDVTHLHTPFNVGWMGRGAARRAGVPTLFTHHTLWEEYVHYIPLVPKAWLRAWVIGLCRGFANGAEVVIAPSAAVRDRFAAQGVTTPIRVVPTGIDTAMFAPRDGAAVRQDLGLAPDQPVMLYAGRMGKEKSLDLLLAAAARVFQAVPTARLVLVGGGPELEPLKDQARALGIAESCHFVGYVPREQLCRYFDAATLFVFASITETQGLVIQEAMAGGLPVAAVAASGVSEAVTEGVEGLLAAHDAPSLAGCILRIVQDPALRARLAAGAAARAADSSLAVMGTRMIEAYREALARYESR